MLVGKVLELRRYPVKSMLGESLAGAKLSTRGMVGDRVCALIDAQTGKVASAKLPHRWKSLLACAARYDERDDYIEIELPDGRRLDPTLEEAGAALSELLERPVRFAFARPDDIEIDRADPGEVEARGADSDVATITFRLGMGTPEGGFFDAFPIHLVASSSLRRVAERSGRPAMEAERFRPNIVIACDDSPAFVENGWVGGLLAIGNDVRLRVVMPTPRCAVPALAHGDLPRVPDLNRVVGMLNSPRVMGEDHMPCLGVHAQVERPGTIALGQEVFVREAGPGA